MRYFALLASAALLASCQSRTAEVEDAAAVRAAPGVYRVSWRGGDGDVNIFTASQPYASPDQLRPVASDAEGDHATVRIDTPRRAYFYVASDKEHGVWTAERLLPLEGGRNFRDLGGYPAADGRSVRWGQLYRSGSMAALTANDFKYLDGLGIRVVCDLRTARERAAEPNAWASNAKLEYWARDYDVSSGDLGRLAAPGLTADKVRDLMMESYRRLPYDHAPAMREVFARLLRGEAPLAFNCTGGKDRAGLTAALILTALGVPRGEVIADYELTNRYLRPEESHARPAMPGKGISAELLKPMAVADPAYIRTAFAEIARRNGSIDGYLDAVLGVDAAARGRLRDLYLE